VTRRTFLAAGAAAQLGRADAVRYMIPAQIEAHCRARHGLQGRRGVGQSHDFARRSAGAERATPGAGGGFVVTASIRGGQVESVELQSLAGMDCRVRNPWSGELQRLPARKGERIVLRKA
jgi:hypothetical protein